MSGWKIAYKNTKIFTGEGMFLAWQKV